MTGVTAGTDPLKVFSCPHCWQGDEWIIGMEWDEPVEVTLYREITTRDPARLTGWRLRCGHLVNGVDWTLWYVPRPGGWLVYFGRSWETPKW